MPDEETDEVCELCGRNMVIKMGRFGRFYGLPRLSGVQEHQAHCGADAWPVPEVRQRHAEAKVQKRAMPTMPVRRGPSAAS